MFGLQINRKMQILKYIDSQNCINTSIEIKKCNEFQDEQLNKSINNSSIVINRPFEYSNNKIIKPSASYTAKGVKYYKRDRLKAQNALNHADYKCEINCDHPTFRRRNSPLNYTEPHHIVPMSKQDYFENSLDVEENIISLCCNCHKQIHLGKGFEDMLRKIYAERKDILKKAGIEILLEDLILFYKMEGN